MFRTRRFGKKIGGIEKAVEREYREKCIDDAIGKCIDDAIGKVLQFSRWEALKKVEKKQI